MILRTTCVPMTAGRATDRYGNAVRLDLPEGVVAWTAQAISRGETAWATSTLAIHRGNLPGGPFKAHDPAVDLTPAAPFSALTVRGGAHLFPVFSAAETGVEIELVIDCLVTGLTA